MRRLLSISVVLIACNSSALAQTTSGASSSVSINNPAPTDTNARVVAAPSIVAPGLAAAGVETCLGSASGGVSIMGGGLIFGRTYPDEGCNIRLAARQLFAFGFQKAAMALMCQDRHVAEAMEAVGQPCSGFVAESKPRRRAAAEDSDNIVTSSIADAGAPRAPANKKAAARAQKAEAVAAVKIVPWKNPDDDSGADLPERVEGTPNPAEERLFARMTAIY